MAFSAIKKSSCTPKVWSKENSDLQNSEFLPKIAALKGLGFNDSLHLCVKISQLTTRVLTQGYWVATLQGSDAQALGMTS